MSEKKVLDLVQYINLALLFFALLTIVLYFSGKTETSFQLSIVTAILLLLSILSQPSVRT